MEELLGRIHSNNVVCFLSRVEGAADEYPRGDGSQTHGHVQEPKQTQTSHSKIAEAMDQKDHYDDLLDDNSLNSRRRKQPVQIWLRAWQAAFSKKANNAGEEPGSKTQI